MQVQKQAQKQLGTPPTIPEDPVKRKMLLQQWIVPHQGSLHQAGKGRRRSSSITKKEPAPSPQVEVISEKKQVPAVLFDKEATQVLFERKMKNPKEMLNLEDTANLLRWLVEKGTECASSLKEKGVLILLGSSGSGKSTCANFLHGCQFRYTKNQTASSLQRVLEVLPISLGGILDPVAPICHGNSSDNNLFPAIIQTPDLEFDVCDIPGFLDTRGPEVSVANAISVANILNSAINVRVLVCVHYSTLLSDRSRGMSTTIQLLVQLFGSEEQLAAFAESILFSVTCAPVSSHASVRKMLKAVFNDLNLSILSENAVLICPYDSLTEQESPEGMFTAAGSFSRDKIIERVKTLQPIPKVRCQIFKTALGSSDVQFFMNLQALLEAHISTNMDKGDFDVARLTLDWINELPLGIRECEKVAFIIEHSVLNMIQNFGFRMSQDFYNCCIPGADFNDTAAYELLHQLRCFCETFKEYSGLDFDSLEKHLSLAIDAHSDYMTTRMNEDAAISSQLKVRALLDSISCSAQLEDQREALEKAMLLVEKEILRIQDPSVRERHSYELQESRATLQKKENDFAALEGPSKHLSTSGSLLTVDKLGVEADAGVSRSEQQIVRAATQKQSDINTSQALQHPFLTASRAKLLTIDDRLHLLDSCIQSGEEFGSLAEGKDLIVFIGNSGAGKSTVVNLLCGCTLVGDDGPPFKIRVLSVQEGGVKDEVAPIGHGIQSSTMFLQIVAAADSETLYCDCPGFNDTRGLAISIGNAVSLQIGLSAARRIKVVVLVNKFTLDAERGQGLADLENSITQLFGSQEGVRAHASSILLGITHAACEELYTAYTCAFEDHPLLSTFLGNTLVIDPLDQTSVRELTHKLDSLDWITNMDFYINLSPDDESEMVLLLSSLLQQVQHCLNDKNFQEAFRNLSEFSRIIGVIAHDRLKTVMGLLQTAVKTYLKPFLEEVNRDYAQEDFVKADQVMQHIANILKFVDEGVYTRQMEYHSRQIQEGASRNFYEKSKQKYKDPAQTLLKKLAEESTHTEMCSLVQLYICTHGERWKRSTNWIVSDSLAGWKGVECDQIGRVISLDLSGNNLSGTLPEDIFDNLQSLTYLNLSNNDLFGEVPDSLNKLEHLQTLLLDNNPDLCGPCPRGPLEGAQWSWLNTSIGGNVKISVEYCSFPFWVCSTTVLLQLERFITHEEAQKVPGLLVQLVAQAKFTSWIAKGALTSEVVTRDNIMFISHHWLTSFFPDDDQNTKLDQLKWILTDDRLKHVTHVWMDYLCVPQSQSNMDKQQRAINSLPYYVRCCSTFMILAGENGRARLDVYNRRGWCRFEKIASFTPAVNEHGEPLSLTRFSHNKDAKILSSVEMTSFSEFDPLEGDFTVDKDKEKIAQPLVTMCVSVLRYSGDDALKDFAKYIINQPEHAIFKEMELLSIQAAKDPLGDLLLSSSATHQVQGDEALLVLEEAKRRLQSITKNEFMELKTLARPPVGVDLVMEAVCIMCGIEPERVRTKKLDTLDYWAASKRFLSDPNFLSRLLNYEADNVSEELLLSLERYLSNPNFEPEKILRISSLASKLCFWVRAVCGYVYISRGKQVPWLSALKTGDNTGVAANDTGNRERRGSRPGPSNSKKKAAVSSTSKVNSSKPVSKKSAHV